MENFVEVRYSQTGESSKTNELGMREMQARAYAKRDAQYLLLKAPPASGKSRALMFIALHKLRRGDVQKVVVSVPERSIGASFKPTNLTRSGFFADWSADVDLIADDGGAEGKIKAFVAFMKDPTQRILLCSHATLRFAFEQLDEGDFDKTLLAIDEFHHVSADAGDNKLGDFVHSILENSTAHVVAMTGSYFRGDGIAVLLPEDEAKFEKVTYDYYDQLNGYRYLKSLGIGFHFYQGKYTSAIGEILDTDKKTLIHIPSVNSRESTGDKYNEFYAILDAIGDSLGEDKETGITKVRRADGKIIKVANLVDDEPKHREKTIGYLRRMKSIDDVDVIVALGMAKEGFDWPFCEVALTVGYRGSLTEVVQIIGRCTRDSFNKDHAQFTNLVAQPDAEDEEVAVAVNDMLKAISCSLLMEQVLAPSYKFNAKVPIDDEKDEPGTIKIKGFKNPSTERTKQIVENDLKDLTAKILQNSDCIKAAVSGEEGAQVLKEILIPKIISETYPDLDSEEVEIVGNHIIANAFFKNNPIVEGAIVSEGTEEREDVRGNDESKPDRRFVNCAGKFININELSFDLISSVNPFQRAYEILSKTLDKRVFGQIREYVAFKRVPMTVERAYSLFKEVQEFCKRTNREPRATAENFHERELAAALHTLREYRRQMERQKNER